MKCTRSATGGTGRTEVGEVRHHRRALRQGEHVTTNSFAYAQLRITGRIFSSLATRTPGTTASLYSLVATCNAYEVNPVDYLRYVLVRISAHTQARIGEAGRARWEESRSQERAGDRCQGLTLAPGILARISPRSALRIADRKAG